MSTVSSSLLPETLQVDTNTVHSTYQVRIVNGLLEAHTKLIVLR